MLDICWDGKTWRKQNEWEIKLKIAFENKSKVIKWLEYLQSIEYIPNTPIDEYIEAFRDIGKGLLKSPGHELQGISQDIIGIAILKFIEDLLDSTGKFYIKGDFPKLITAMALCELAQAYFSSIDHTDEIKTLELKLIKVVYDDCIQKYEQLTRWGGYIRDRVLSKMSYHQYLKTPEWATIRERKLKQAHFQCELCSGTNKLQVHHKTYVHLGNEWDNDLIVLCDNCHARFHNKLAKELQ